MGAHRTYSILLSLRPGGVNFAFSLASKDFIRHSSHSVRVMAYAVHWNDFNSLQTYRPLSHAHLSIKRCRQPYMSASTDVDEMMYGSNTLQNPNLPSLKSSENSIWTFFGEKFARELGRAGYGSQTGQHTLSFVWIEYLCRKKQENLLVWCSRTAELPLDVMCISQRPVTGQDGNRISFFFSSLHWHCDQTAFCHRKLGMHTTNRDTRQHAACSMQYRRQRWWKWVMIWARRCFLHHMKASNLSHYYAM